MNQNYSLIQKLSYKNTLFICILVLFLDIVKLVKFHTIANLVTNVAVWFPFCIGIILISLSVIKIVNQAEKIGIIFFGFAFIFDAFAKLLGLRIFLYFSIGLEALTIYSFYLFFKEFRAHSQNK